MISINAPALADDLNDGRLTDEQFHLFVAAPETLQQLQMLLLAFRMIAPAQGAELIAQTEAVIARALNTKKVTRP